MGKVGADKEDVKVPSKDLGAFMVNGLGTAMPSGPRDASVELTMEEKEIGGR